MIIQKIYTDTPAGERLWTSIRLLKLAKSRKHNLAMSKADEFISRGMVTISGNTLTFNTPEGPMPFTILQRPCAECLVCGEIINYEWDLRTGHPDRGKAVREHVNSLHPTATPNIEYPANYKVRSYYELEATDSVPTIHEKASAIVNRAAAIRAGGNN